MEDTYPDKLHRTTVGTSIDTSILPTLRNDKWKLLDEMSVFQRTILCRLLTNASGYRNVSCRFHVRIFS